jgi:hypothetical protein
MASNARIGPIGAGRAGQLPPAAIADMRQSAIWAVGQAVVPHRRENPFPIQPATAANIAVVAGPAPRQIRRHFLILID